MEMWKKAQNHFTPTKENAYRPGILGRSSLVFFLALTLAVEGFLVAGLVARESDGSFLSAVVASDIITFTNTERQGATELPLKENALLDQAAQAKAEDMATKGYFAHVAPDGTVPWAWITQAGYGYQSAGENLAVHFTDSKDVVNAWMASPSHRDNILRARYTYIGVGVADGVYKGQPATFVVQYFSTPKPGAVTRTQNSSAVAAVAQSFGVYTQAFAQYTLRSFGDPVQVANWILGLIGLILLVGISLGFIMHIDIQSHETLVGGFVVAAVAFVCLMANLQFVTAPTGSVVTGHSAGVIDAYDLWDNQFAAEGKR